MLDQLQVKTEADERYLWGEHEESEGGEDNTPAKGRGSVVAADFYNAGALLSLPDEELAGFPFSSDSFHYSISAIFGVLRNRTVPAAPSSKRRRWSSGQ